MISCSSSRGLLRICGTAALVVLLVASSLPARAQSSREELLAQAQAEKKERLELEGPEAAEKAVIWILRSPLLAGSGGPYPWFGSIYQGTGTAVGGGYLKRMPYRSRVNLLAAVSVTGSTLVEARASLPEFWQGRIAIGADARRFTANDLSFFGLGSESRDEEAVEYELKPTTVGATATVRATPWLQLGGEYRWLQTITELRSRVRAADVPGLGATLRYRVLRATAAVDWRTSPGYSTRGGLYRITWSRFDETRDQPYSFDSVEYEAVQLVPLLREQFVLAFHGVVTVSSTEEGQRVPFQLAPFLGSGTTLRGFETFRFTDRNRILLTGEYRWRPSRFLDMAVFLDAGKVTAEAGDIDLTELETSWGVGARFHGPTFNAVRAELAKSREGWRVLVSVRQAF